MVDAYLITEYQDIASLAAIKPSAQKKIPNLNPKNVIQSSQLKVDGEYEAKKINKTMMSRSEEWRHAAVNAQSKKP